MHGLDPRAGLPAPRSRRPLRGTHRPGPGCLGNPRPGACGLRRLSLPESYRPPALRGPRRTAFGSESERGLSFGVGGVREPTCGSQAGLGAPGSHGSCFLWREGSRCPPDSQYAPGAGGSGPSRIGTCCFLGRLGRQDCQRRPSPQRSSSVQLKGSGRTLRPASNGRPGEDLARLCLCLPEGLKFLEDDLALRNPTASPGPLWTRRPDPELPGRVAPKLAALRTVGCPGLGPDTRLVQSFIFEEGFLSLFLLRFC